MDPVKEGVELATPDDPLPGTSSELKPAVLFENFAELDVKIEDNADSVRLLDASPLELDTVDWL